MAWTSTNPVSIGDPTKKDHFDKLWDNAQYLYDRSSSRGRIDGLVLSNDTDTDHDISIAAGEAADSTAVYMLRNSSALVKRIDASWAAGTGNGGMATGSVGVSTWYHVHLIRKDSDGTVDAMFDTSVTAANKPAGYTYYRRIGSVLTDGSSNIIGFYQIGDYFFWKVPVTDVNGATPANTNAVTQTLTVPTGVVVRVIFSGAVSWVSNSMHILFTELAGTDTAPSGSLFDAVEAADALIGAYQVEIFTNTSAQIRWRTDSTAGTVYINTKGWLDLRGKN